MPRFPALAAAAIASVLVLGACASEDASGSGGGGGSGNGGGGSGNGGGGSDGVTRSEELTGAGPEAGIATYYAATGAGNCSFEPSPEDLDVAAMNAPQYANSAVCGACAKVVGPKGEVVVRIVDQCPECERGHLDLSEEAFAKIAEVSAGRVDVQWTRVSCEVRGPIRYHFKDGSSQWWTAIQVRNHRVPIAKLEVETGAGWRELQRESYNYFVAESGVGDGPFSVRVTGSNGVTLEDTLDGVVAEATVDGAKQFD